ncbi:MAG: cytochrome b/b6 domain-containing protein [Betaproteobacteria bacterium]
MLTEPPGEGAPAVRRITDAPTRLLHWLLALSFSGAYLTGDSDGWRQLHITLGYSVACLLAWRLVYGLIGPKQARLSLWWRKLSALPGWLSSLSRQPDSWGPAARQGQHLVTALSTGLILMLVIPLTLSGHATYEEWGAARGDEWMQELHELVGNIFLTVVLLHIGMIALLSLLQRRNLAKPMLSGRIDGQGPSPVRYNRMWLAALMLALWLGLVAWLWHIHPQPSL